MREGKSERVQHGTFLRDANQIGLIIIFQHLKVVRVKAFEKYGITGCQIMLSLIFSVCAKVNKRSAREVTSRRLLPVCAATVSLKMHQYTLDGDSFLSIRQ